MEQKKTAGAKERNALPENLALHARNCAMVGDLVGMRAAFHMLEEKAHQMPGQSQEEMLDGIKLQCHQDYILIHCIPDATNACMKGEYDAANKMFEEAMQYVLKEVHGDPAHDPQEPLKRAIQDAAIACFRQIAQGKGGMQEAEKCIQACNLFGDGEKKKFVFETIKWLKEQRKKKAEKGKTKQG
ncbi:MAG TPA: hypothetical protein VJC16_06760 [Candidatus Nanoarchaeia archaeon]|nr:hypothetical protein [Candidatus Nanoarchaeia archaeon]